MRRKAVAGWLIGLVCLLPARGFPAPGAPEVATITDLRGAVEHRSAEGADWGGAHLDQGLRLKEAVRTGERSTTELRFVDQTLLALGERTRLTITLTLFDVRAAPAEIRLALEAGRADVDVPLAAARPLRVEGPAGASPVDLAPGQRVRLTVSDGRLVLSPLPAGVTFASAAWDTALDGADLAAGAASPLGADAVPPGGRGPLTPGDGPFFGFDAAPSGGLDPPTGPADVGAAVRIELTPTP